MMVVVKDECGELYSPLEVCCTKDRLHEERTMVERNTERNTVVSENKRLDCMMSGHAMVDNISKIKTSSNAFVQKGASVSIGRSIQELSSSIDFQIFGLVQLFHSSNTWHLMKFHESHLF